MNTDQKAALLATDTAKILWARLGSEAEIYIRPQGNDGQLRSWIVTAKIEHKGHMLGVSQGINALDLAGYTRETPECMADALVSWLERARKEA